MMKSLQTRRATVAGVIGAIFANSGEDGVIAPIHYLFDQNESLLLPISEGLSSEIGSHGLRRLRQVTVQAAGRIKSIVPDTVLRGATWCRYPNRGHATTANLALHLSG